MGHTLEAVKNSGLFQTLWVSTNDSEVAQVARQFGASVHSRPAQLASDTARLLDVCLDFTRWLDEQGTPAETLCLVLPTAALMQPEDLQKGYALLQKQGADFCMGITTFLETPFWALKEEGGFLKSFFGTEYLVASQKLPPVWVDSGYFYFARVAALRREQTLYGQKLVGCRIPRERSIDIDEPAHMLIAEALMDVLERSSAQVKP